MTEREARELAKRRKAMKQKRIRQVRMIRLAFFVVMLVLCACTGLLLGRLAKGRRLDNALQAQAKNQSMFADMTGESYRETASIQIVQEETPEINALYSIHVGSTDSWSRYFPDNAYGMAAKDDYVNAIRVTLKDQPEDMTGTVTYQANVSGSGWQDWVEDAHDSGLPAGTEPIESIRIKLTGDLSELYDILYSVLQGTDGWTDWSKNGEDAGTAGAGKRVDGIRVSVVKKQGEEPVYAGNINPTLPMVALTYDDGPSAGATPRILNALRENGGRATFFMVGQQAAKHPELIKMMADGGNEVANHTYDHTLMNKVDPVQLTWQLEQTNQVVSDACGISPVLMRPCGGIRNEAGMNAVGSISMPAVMWSIDTKDWKTRDAQATIQTVLEQVQDGDIILMHDLYDSTAEASEQIIPELIRRGYQLVTVSELSSYRGGMLPGHSYGRFRAAAN